MARRSSWTKWEHEGNRAVRRGQWKLVSRYPDKWELYNLEADRTELRNLADAEPARLKEMVGEKRTIARENVTIEHGVLAR